MSTDRRGGTITLTAMEPIGMGMSRGRGAEWKRGRRTLDIDSATTTTRAEGESWWMWIKAATRERCRAGMGEVKSHRRSSKTRSRQVGLGVSWTTASLSVVALLEATNSHSLKSASSRKGRNWTPVADMVALWAVGPR